MKIVIKSTNIELSQEIKDYIEEKIGGLEKLADVFSGEIYFDGYLGKGKPRVEAWVDVGKLTKHHRTGPYFRAEVQMHLPGKSIRSEAVAESLKLAICQTKDELQELLKKYDEKIIAKERRGARVFKILTHLSPLTWFNRKKGGRSREEGL